MAKNDSVVVGASNLGAAYGSHPVWQNADFKIKRGELAAILGSNGAGKTTLFRLILGLMQPSSGSLKLFGQKPKKGNRRIGYVPQRHQIDSETRLEAVELVALGYSGSNWGFDRRLAAKGQTKAMEALGEVDGLDLAHRPLGSLSGGELQRVFLAQALVSQPDLLLLDEPLANLDVRRQTSLVQLIAKVAKQHQVAVLLIAHDINPLLPVMDEIIYIAGGKVATGKPSQVITTESLSGLYGAPVEVLRDSRGRVAVLGIEEAVHHE